MFQVVKERRIHGKKGKKKYIYIDRYRRKENELKKPKLEAPGLSI